MSRNYEFTEAQNQKFMMLHNWLRIFSIVLIIAGVLVIINGARQMMGPQGISAWPVVAVGILRGALGILLLRPLDNIKNIVNTSGSDIQELMIAFNDFSQAFYFGIIVAIAHAVIVGWRLIAIMGSGG